MAWFKTKYKEWCIPYTQSGWNFDEETQLFIANDAAWQSYFKVSYLFQIVKEFSKVYMQVYPDSRLFQYNPLRNRDELAELFTGIIVQGVAAVTIQQTLAQRNLAAAGALGKL